MKLTKAMSRSQRQKAVYDQMLTPMKDFYDFARDCYRELGKEKRRERIFRRYVRAKSAAAGNPMAGMDRTDPECSEKTGEQGTEAKAWKGYVSALADKLAAESPSLLRWSTQAQGQEELAARCSAAMWEKSLTLWCQEDSFPSLYDRELPCGKRDVVLYVLMVAGFTVEESQEMLGEFSRRKDRSEVRPLYPLDFKEGFFLWLLRWNENHPRDPVSYTGACRLYEDYGKALLRWLADQIRAVEEEMIALRSGWETEAGGTGGDMEEELAAFQETGRKLWQRLRGATDLFEEEQAEDAKRLLSVVTCAKRYAAYEKQAQESGVRERAGQKGGEWRQREFQRRNRDTRMDRGTSYMSSRLDELAKREDFDQAFSELCRILWEEFGEAHWRTYSTLIWLYGQSGRENWKNRLFLPGVRPSVKTVVGRQYGTVDIFRGEGQRQSFSLSGKSVSRLVDSQAANGKLISNLLTPVLRNENLGFSQKSIDSSVVLSNLKNNYQNWQKGSKGPYEYYKRGTVLKFLLAAGIEEPGRLSRLMEMAGSSGLDYLDAREAMVYLTACRRAKLKGIYDNLVSMEDSFALGDCQEELCQQAAGLLCALPPELGVSLLGLEAGGEERLPQTAALIRRDPFVVEDEVFPELEKWLETSLIADLKQLDSLFVCFDAERGTPEETAGKLFYGPYTGDFQKADENKKAQWAAFMKAAWAVILAAGDWIREPERMIWERWWSGLASGQTFAAETMDYRVGGFLENHRIQLVRELQSRLGGKTGEELEKRWGIDAEGKAKEILSDLETRLQQLNDTAERAVFLCQQPCALEAEAALELWFYALALWEAIGAGQDSEAYRSSEALLREKSYYWYCVCQMESFDLKGYQKLTGCGNYGEKKERKRESVVTVWRRQETDGYPFADEKELQVQTVFQMWERIYYDIVKLEEGMRALRDGNPALFRTMEAVYRRYDAMLQGPVKEEWEKAIREQAAENAMAEKKDRLRRYYGRIYYGTADRIGEWF